MECCWLWQFFNSTCKHQRRHCFSVIGLPVFLPLVGSLQGLLFSNVDIGKQKNRGPQQGGGRVQKKNYMPDFCERFPFNFS